MNIPPTHLKKLTDHLTLYGLSASAAEDLTASILDGSCPYLTFKYIGERNHNTKHTVEQIRHACHLIQEKPKLSLASVARLSKVSIHALEKVFAGETWRHVSTHFDFSRKQTLLKNRRNPHGKMVGNEKQGK
jgi:hypothetical protein